MNSSSQKPTATERPEPESSASVKTFPQRTKRPGEVGLANESRPGLGTRAEPVDPDAAGNVDRKIKISAENAREGALPQPPVTRPEPAEQDSNSLAQREQRDTGVSGHSGGM